MECNHSGSDWNRWVRTLGDSSPKRRHEEDLLREHTVLTNRFREQLRRYFPRFIEVVAPLGATWTLDLWSRIPSPATARKTRGSTIEKLREEHRIRKVQAKSLLDALRIPGPTVADGTEDAARVCVLWTIRAPATLCRIWCKAL